jgi:hypothetical protein
VMGVIYVLPPFCLMKYIELGMRLHDIYNPESHVNKSFNHPGNHWKEWGFYNPRAL